jgi:hypothetical protein
MKLEDIQMLLKELEYAKQTENETVKDFWDRFDRLLYQIPENHHPEDKYLFYLFSDALLVHLGFLLSKKTPKKINEDYNMAMRIGVNISLSK